MQYNEKDYFEKKTVSAGGVDIYSLKSPGLHSFCLCVYARAGVLYEKDECPGISHFVEHIVFRNINILMNGGLYDTLDSLGLTFTAATYKEFMQFCITGESSKFSLAAEIILKLFEPLGDGLLNGDFELERGRIRAEIREYDERSSLDYLVKKTVWGNTQLENMITGTLGSVSKITLGKCERARKRIFSKNNFFFYVTGNFSDRDITALACGADKYRFEEFALRENICEIPDGYMNREQRVLTKNSEYYMVEMCFDIDTVSSSKEARSLLYDIMFSGENCLFFRKLSENLGYIYSYDAKIEEYKNAGNISVSYEVNLKNLYDSILAAADIFANIKNDASGLERAKVYYTDNACLMLDNAEELNWNMAYENHILGDKISGVYERCGRYERISRKDITELARNVFLPQNLVIGVKGRKKLIDTVRISEIIAKLGGE